MRHGIVQTCFYPCIPVYDTGSSAFCWTPFVKLALQVVGKVTDAGASFCHIGVSVSICGADTCIVERFFDEMFTAYQTPSTLQDSMGSPAAISVTSDQAAILSISFSEVKTILAKTLPLGDPTTDRYASQALQAALKRCQLFSKLAESLLHTLAVAMVSIICNAGKRGTPCDFRYTYYPWIHFVRRRTHCGT